MNVIRVKTTTKITFFITLICLLICSAMLAGTTLAFFSDYEVIEKNRVISGNLDLELESWDKTLNNYQGGYIDATQTALFQQDIWAPGHMEVSYMRVVNTGSLAVKYELNINGKETPYVNEHGQTVLPSDFLEGKVICNKVIAHEGDLYPDKQAVLDVDGYDFDLKSAYEKGDFILKPGEMGYFAFMVYMPIEVTTEAAPDGDIEAEKSRITITVDVVGTQVSMEEDGFQNSYYDKDFTYPIISSSELQRDLQLGGILSYAKDIEDTSATENTVNKPIVLDLNGKTFTAKNKDAFVVRDGADVQVQGNGVVQADGNCFDIQDGTVTILNGTYQGGANGIKIGENGKLVVRGGTFVNFDPTEYLALNRTVVQIDKPNGDSWYLVD